MSFQKKKECIYGLLFPQTSIVHACFFRYRAVSNQFRSYLDVDYQLLKSLFSTLNTNGARY